MFLLEKLLRCKVPKSCEIPKSGIIGGSGAKFLFAKFLRSNTPNVHSSHSAKFPRSKSYGGKFPRSLSICAQEPTVQVPKDTKFGASS
jgi:hypothetical protein